MDLGFEGKVALVTGASSGLGIAIADAFAQNGVAGLGAHYHRGEQAALEVRERARQAGAVAAVFGADLSAPGAAERLVAATLKHFGRVDILVNNAGAMVERSSIPEASDELFDQILNLNYRAVFATCRAVVPVMQRQGGGAIVNISSSAARNGGAGGSVLYAAAKGAVSTFTRGLAAELARDHIRVNVVGPGLFDTPFHHVVTPPEQLKRIEATIPLGRAGRPEECAGPVLFLASEKMASYITGQSLEVNGGRLMP